jgi:hypothetical protein
MFQPRDLVSRDAETRQYGFAGRLRGSNLISTYDNDPSRVSVPLGGLDQAPANKLEGHFFVGSKAPWFEITDGLPQYDTWPGSRVNVRKTSGEA